MDSDPFYLCVAVESPNSEAFLGSNVFSGRRVGFASFALLSPSQYGDLVLLCSMIRAPTFWCSVCAPCSGDLVLSCSHAPCSMLHALVILCSHAHVLGVLVLSCSHAPAFWCSTCAPCSGGLVLSCSSGVLMLSCSHALMLWCSFFLQ